MNEQYHAGLCISPGTFATTMLKSMHAWRRKSNIRFLEAPCISLGGCVHPLDFWSVRWSVGPSVKSVCVFPSRNIILSLVGVIVDVVVIDIVVVVDIVVVMSGPLLKMEYLKNALRYPLEILHGSKLG